MTYDLALPAQLMAALLPDLLLMGGAMALMLLAAWRPDSDAHQRLVGKAAMGLIVLVIAAVVWMGTSGASANLGPIAVDGFRWTVDLVILLGALGTIAIAVEHNTRDGITQAESHVLVLLATSGMMILAAGRDLMVIFLGIEIMSVAVYVLAGLNRRSPRSAEASLKYFLLGAFATAFLLYGIALVYGATGATSLEGIRAAIGTNGISFPPIFVVGLWLMLIGMAFKVAAVPFHMWAPDVYDGAPTPVTAFMAATVKAAAFATFMRIWYEAFYFTFAAWALVIWWLAVITMVVGNVVALAQKNIKRMLAYSSIVHTGYLLAAVVTASSLGSAAFTFYVMAYTLATLGSFAVVAALQRPGETDAPISSYEGLWHVRPWLAVAMAVYLLALLGFPIFGGVGFFAKWYLLQALLSSPIRLTAIAVIIVLTSVISAGYYLQVVRVMFMKPRPEGAAEVPPVGMLTRAVLTATAVLILALGLFPSSLTGLAIQSAFRPYPLAPAAGVPIPRAVPEVAP
jgi:NADH-quinone oxidoreductase subunit N